MRTGKKVDLQFLVLALPIFCFVLIFSYSIWNDGSEMRRLKEAGGNLALRENGEPYGADFSIPEFEDRHLKLLNDMPDLTILMLADSRITSKGMADVSKFSKLKLLDLSGTGPLGESLAGLPRLNELRLSRRKISRAEIQQVATQTDLVQLYLGETDIDDEGLKRLANLKSLLALDLSHCTEISDVGLKHLRGCPRLVNLNLMGCRQVTDRGLVDLATLTDLNSLVLNGTSVTPSGLRRFTKEMPQVRVEADPSTLSLFQFLKKWNVSGRWDENYDLKSLTFSIDGSEIPDPRRKSIKKTLRLTASGFSQLVARPETHTVKQIHFGVGAVPHGAIELVAALPKLESLSLMVTQKNRDGLKNLSALNERLRRVSLWGKNLTDDDLAHVAGLTNLESISFGGSPITDVGLIHFRDLTKLKVIDLDNTLIDGSGLVHLRKLTKLEVLDIRRTKLTDEGLEYLADLPKLKTLYVWRTNVTSGGLERLKDARPDLNIVGE